MNVIKIGLHKTYTYLLLSVFLFILTGCYVPEKFVARVDVHENGSYTMTYEGTVISMIAIGRKLSSGDERMLISQTKRIARDPEVKHIEYLGKGRYRLHMVVNRKANQRGYIFGKDMKVLQVIPHKDHSLQIFVKDMKPKDIYQLRQSGVKIDGKLIVTVSKGMRIIGSKPDKTPSLLGLIGNYEWNVNSFQKKINIKVLLKNFIDPEKFSNAIETNNYQTVKALLDQGYNPNMMGSPNIEPVICFSAGSPKMLKLLLAYGANPNVLCFNQTTKETSSLLKDAVYWNDTASAKLLLEYGASLDSHVISRKKMDTEHASLTDIALTPIVHDYSTPKVKTTSSFF